MNIGELTVSEKGIFMPAGWKKEPHIPWDDVLKIEYKRENIRTWYRTETNKIKIAYVREKKEGYKKLLEYWEDILLKAFWPVP